MRKNKKYTVYSLFTRAGGFDIGFEEAGFEIIGASDIWKESEKTMNFNFSNLPFICKDIRLLTSKEILESTNGQSPDIIIGGPPCQGFSVMGDKNSADPRNSLFESYTRIVDDLKSKCFVFENVKGIKTMFNDRYLNMVANSFADLDTTYISEVEYGKRNITIISLQKLLIAMNQSFVSFFDSEVFLQMNDKIMVVELFDSIGLLKSQNFVKKIARTLRIIDNQINFFYD